MLTVAHHLPSVDSAAELLTGSLMGVESLGTGLGQCLGSRSCPGCALRYLCIFKIN